MSEAIYDRIYNAVRQIPYGQVASYGQVATVVGAEVTARQVGDAMAALRDHHPQPPVPWQRVINAQGKVSTGPRQQDARSPEARAVDRSASGARVAVFGGPAFEVAPPIGVDRFRILEKARVEGFDEAQIGAGQGLVVLLHDHSPG